ncbi:T9SS type A sorting domain-containing protein [candidate division KSB1 bacterium]|nr:T9SS type A sorting domain-containing protein [candidate division KSB1 bacterium]
MNGKSAYHSILEISLTDTKLLSYDLEQNFPNPFNASTLITNRCPKVGSVRLNIFTNAGRHVKTLVDKQHHSGTYTVQWNGLDADQKAVASGLYLCVLESEGTRMIKKVLLVK